MKHYIGIDPGQKGFVVVIDEKGKFVNAFSLLRDHKVVDVNDLVTRLFDLSIYEDDCHIILEDVHSIFGSSAKSNFNFGWIVGVIEGQFHLLECHIQKWLQRLGKKLCTKESQKRMIKRQ